MRLGAKLERISAGSGNECAAFRERAFWSRFAPCLQPSPISAVRSPAYADYAVFCGCFQSGRELLFVDFRCCLRTTQVWTVARSVAFGVSQTAGKALRYPSMMCSDCPRWTEPARRGAVNAASLNH